MNILPVSTPSKIVLTAFGTSMLLTLMTAVPDGSAVALTLEEPQEQRQVQELTTAEHEELNIPLEAPEAEISQEWLDAQEAIRLAEEEKARVAAAKAAEEAATPNMSSHVFKDVPPGEGAQGLVDAALAQVGVHQDCTDLVQNSLAAIGKTERRDRGGFDLGTGIWQYDGFGTRVDIKALAPGDIIIYGNAGSGTHVSIYIGNGQAVHGGYSGNNTMIAPVDAAYQAITGAIRV